jgi:hypothetical protein
VWLPWEYSAVGAALAFPLAAWLRIRGGSLRSIAAVVHESAIVASLYTLWQLAGQLSVVHLEGAIGRGVWLWDVERMLLIPNEATWQQVILPYGWLVQASNIYYGGAHVPAMGIFLVWLFFRHRDRYRPWRNATAWVTGLCLVIQLLPVAPPRLVDSLGVVDTGELYGQSVYASFGSTVAGQLQAMPSIHVGWAVLIGWAVWVESPSRWRSIGWFHAALTAVVVVVTGNHYWLDGAVAALILVAIRLVQLRTLALKPQGVVRPTHSTAVASR